MSSKRVVWAEWIAARERSGESAAAFCRRHGLKYAQWRYWQRALRGVDVPPHAPALVPVQVAAPVATGARLTVVLPDGVQVQVPLGVAVAEVVALVRGLAC